MWVWIESGDKLGGRVHERHWMGIDEQSKGAQIYWPDKKTVSIERNIYYDKTVVSASCLKEEEQGIVKTKANSPQVLNASNTSSNDNPSVDFPAPVTPPCIPSPPLQLPNPLNISLLPQNGQCWEYCGMDRKLLKHYLLTILLTHLFGT